MIRERLKQALDEAVDAGDEDRVAVIRLIMTALKDRDLAAHAKGGDGLDDDDILAMLQTMIRQREESIARYEQTGRVDLAEQERAESEAIASLLPEQLSDDEVEEAVRGVIDEVGARGLKELGRTMAELKKRYAGQMDFTKASVVAKRLLSD